MIVDCLDFSIYVFVPPDTTANISDILIDEKLYHIALENLIQ